MKEVEKFESYLGLPTLIGRAKNQTFSFLKDRVWKKLQGWKGLMLSRAGKEVLIKAVAQSIPTYTMGVFQLPKSLCDDLEAMYAKFWWGQVGNERKIHWKSWTSSKKKGGMGFRDLRSFNLAMLAKQGWRLIHENGSLLSLCFKAKYFPRCHFLDATVPPNCSYVWRSIMAAKPILEKRCCWRVGDGSSIRIFSDRWLPNHPTNKVLIPLYEEAEVRTVSELIDQEQREWRREFIMANFHCDDADAICRIPLSRRSVMDSIVWLHNKKGVYSVKSGYHIARQIIRDGDVAESSSSPTGQFVWAKLWNLHVPTKIKVFGWRTC